MIRLSNGLLLGLLLLAGCAETPVRPEKIVVPINATVTIVTTPEQMPCANAEGCYTFTPWQSHEIWILATHVKGKYFVHQATFGHEFAHVLNHSDATRFPNPDTTVWQRGISRDDLFQSDLD